MTTKKPALGDFLFNILRQLPSDMMSEASSGQVAPPLYRQLVLQLRWGTMVALYNFVSEPLRRSEDFEI